MASRVRSPGAFQLGVDGNEIILAADLHAVAGIEEQREVGAIELAAELAHLVLHAALVEIAALDHVETELAQHLSDVGGIVCGIGQPVGMPVIAVADHQGDARTRGEGQWRDRCGRRSRSRRNSFAADGAGPGGLAD